MTRTWQATAVTLKAGGEERSAERVGGRHTTHWACPFCGWTFTRLPYGEHCRECAAQVTRVEVADG